MKKLIFIPLIFLAITLLVGLTSQSGQIYQQERVLWWIHNDFKKIANPYAFENERLVQKIVERYNGFIQRYPKSTLVPKARLMLGATLKAQRKYSEARLVFEEIARSYPYDNEVVAKALFAIAQSHENEDNWPKAVTVYRAIIKEYPLTLTGFSIPFYLGGFYQARGLTSTARNAYIEAAEFYQNIAVNHPDSPLGLSALKFVVRSYLAVGEWMNAYYAARESLMKYPVSSSLHEIIQMVHEISIKKMNDPERVIKTYAEFISRNPGHPINKELDRSINELKSTKAGTETIYSK